MKLLLAFLLLLVPVVAGAHELGVNEQYPHGVIHSHAEETRQKEIDRFLSEKVEPHIAYAERKLNPGLTDDGFPIIPNARAEEIAIAHYLRALVEIEAERLRREK